MKRRKAEFYQEVHAIRDKYGETEYDRDDLLPTTFADQSAIATH